MNVPPVLSDPPWKQKRTRPEPVVVDAPDIIDEGGDAQEPEDVIVEPE